MTQETTIWHPMETAPRDGTLILVKTRSPYRIRQCMTTYWQQSLADRHGEAFGWYFEGNGCLAPTGWMHAPEHDNG